MTRGIVFVLALSIVGGITANMYLREGRVASESAVIGPAVPDVGGLVLKEPRKLPSFTLLNADAQVFRETDFIGAWSFLYFGFTFCPDICPTSLAEMAKIKRTLALSLPEVKPEFYFVTVDPLRDTPDRIRDYVSFFDSSFRGLTGDVAEIDKLADAAAVVYQVPDNATADGDYGVGHSSTIVLIDPYGDVRAIFTPPLQSPALVDDFILIEKWWSETQYN